MKTLFLFLILSSPFFSSANDMWVPSEEICFDKEWPKYPRLFFDDEQGLKTKFLYCRDYSQPENNFVKYFWIAGLPEFSGKTVNLMELGFVHTQNKIEYQFKNDKGVLWSFKPRPGEWSGKYIADGTLSKFVNDQLVKTYYLRTKSGRTPESDDNYPCQENWLFGEGQMVLGQGRIKMKKQTCTSLMSMGGRAIIPISVELIDKKLGTDLKLGIYDPRVKYIRTHHNENDKLELTIEETKYSFDLSGVVINRNGITERLYPEGEEAPTQHTPFVRKIRNMEEFKVLSQASESSTLGHLLSLNYLYNISTKEIYYINSNMFSTHYDFVKEGLSLNLSQSEFEAKAFRRDLNRQFSLGKIVFYSDLELPNQFPPKKKGLFTMELFSRDLIKPNLLVETYHSVLFNLRIDARGLVNDTILSYKPTSREQEEEYLNRKEEYKKSGLWRVLLDEELAEYK